MEKKKKKKKKKKVWTEVIGHSEISAIWFEYMYIKHVTVY